ncbi:MAG: hypothetical protein EZS28_022942 [Streblomastix strix]|uniref:Uncharacterized protein n=1 Tax=Streblomastix strix TaxID=222440 RepID=A0A5J4VGH5_9EUKA|nr:MAG: hypothetical protein EZS28_022942 [Streblomastix strix]
MMLHHSPSDPLCTPCSDHVNNVTVSGCPHPRYVTFPSSQLDPQQFQRLSCVAYSAVISILCTFIVFTIELELQILYLQRMKYTML